MKKYVIMYTRGAAWNRTKTVFQQDLFAHGKYMSKLFGEGKIESGGPFYNDKGGMTILNVESEEEALEIMDNDPAIKKNIFNGEIIEWMSVDWKNY